MSNGRKYDDEAIYEIRLLGVLDQTWSDWFDGFTISRTDHETFLQGTVADQSALHGVLMKINGLGLTLISVRRRKRR